MGKYGLGVISVNKVDLGYDLTDMLTMGCISPDWHDLSYCICYKGVPLWSASSNVVWDAMEVWLDAGGDDEPYMLIMRDWFDDLFTYGSWGTLEEALAWLKNPTPLY